MNKKKEIQQNIETKKLHSLDEAISFFLTKYLKKFDETIELTLKLDTDNKQPYHNIKGVVTLPHSLKKKRKIALIVEKSRINEARKYDAEIIGSEDLVEKIKNGFLDFQVCITTPIMMSKVSALGKILGPRNLMPSPNLGTVSNNIAIAIQNIKKGQVMFKTDKNRIIHSSVAKLSFTKEKIKENANKMYKAILAIKPEKLKNSYIQKIFLSCTQGPSLKLDLKSFLV